jgi:hypothetical protein
MEHEMEKSDTLFELTKALAKFQSEMKAVKKGAKNPFFKSSYADLASIIDAIREPLSSNGLAFTQFPVGDGGLTTMLMHSSGEWMSETFTMKPIDNKPQTIGSCITYSRRYALGAVLGLATEEDDDGNRASMGASPTLKAVPYTKPTYKPAAVHPTEASFLADLDKTGAEIDAKK